METLARWAGYMAIAGGALMAIVVAITTYDPNSPAWVAFFLVILLLGAAVLGFQERTKAATGQLGRWSAWLSALGALGLLVVFVYAFATGSPSTSTSAGSTYNPATDPLTPFWIVTAAAWFLGNLSYAVALIRGKALSAIGAWLVLAGAVVGLAVTAVLGANVPTWAYLLFGLFGIGWIVVGYEALRPVAAPAT